MWLGKLRAIIYSDFCFPDPIFSRTWIKTREGCVAILSGMIWFPSFLFTVNILATCIPKILETSRRVLGANANLPKNPFGTQSKVFWTQFSCREHVMRGFHAECLVLRRGDSTRGLRSAGASDVGLSEKCKVGSRLFYTISPGWCGMHIAASTVKPFFSQNSDKSLTCSVVWKAVARLDRCGNLVH